MLIRSQLDENTAFYIDCEAVGGVNKEEMDHSFHPDDALDYVVRFASGVAARLAAAAEDASAAMPPPRKIDLEFAIRIDSNATVAIARTPEGGQFRVRVGWEP